jgi:hypothetical protein
LQDQRSKNLRSICREGHHQFLNYYGLPEARLMRTHSIEGSERKRDVRFLSLLATAAMFGVPALVLEHVEKLHVDGIVNLLDIRKFLDHFNDDNIKHSTLVCNQLLTYTFLISVRLFFLRRALSWQ